MHHQEWRRDGYLVSTDPERIDVPFVHRFLSESSYWAAGRPFDVVSASIASSLCFGVYVEGEGVESGKGKQVGFARVVTDEATFGWLCDLFIDDGQRGHGLSKWLLECVVSHPSLEGLARLVLATRDAHELYRRYGGFEYLPHPEWWMIRNRRQ